MKMTAFIIVLALGLVVCAALVRRHGQRSAMPPTMTPASAVQPVDAWQKSIKLSPLGDDPTAVRLKNKLREEEARQKPAEARN